MSKEIITNQQCFKDAHSFFFWDLFRQEFLSLCKTDMLGSITFCGEGPPCVPQDVSSSNPPSPRSWRIKTSWSIVHLHTENHASSNLFVMLTYQRFWLQSPSPTLDSPQKPLHWQGPSKWRSLKLKLLFVINPPLLKLSAYTEAEAGRTPTTGEGKAACNREKTPVN